MQILMVDASQEVMLICHEDEYLVSFQSAKKWKSTNLLNCSDGCVGDATVTRIEWSEIFAAGRIKLGSCFCGSTSK